MSDVYTELAQYVGDMDLQNQCIIYLSVMLPIKWNLEKRQIYISKKDCKLYIDKFYTEKLPAHLVTYMREIIYDENPIINDLIEIYGNYVMSVVNDKSGEENA